MNSFSVYVTYLVNKSGFLFRFWSSRHLCWWSGSVLICTRQRPVGREDRINFALERRSNCHLWIWRRISLFPLLSSRWSAKRRRVLNLLWWLWALGPWTKQSMFPQPKSTGGQKEISHSAHKVSKDRSAVLTCPLSTCTFLSSSSVAINHIGIDAAWATLSINWYFQSEFKSTSGFQCGHEVLKQNI